MGLGDAGGAAVIQPLGAVGWVTVMLTTTAPTPVAGTPPLPVTVRLRVAPGPRGVVVRVSRDPPG